MKFGRALSRCLALGICLLWGGSGARATSVGEESRPGVANAIGLESAFAEKGLKLGSPIFIRVYKQSSELEMWVQQGARYVLFRTYPICRWSGSLGPKIYEGDRQSPEGFYHITSSDLFVNQHWHRAMQINYPNTFDVLNGRTGSHILIHGKCSSIGCFAIQDENVEEVYDAVRAAFSRGQLRIPVLSLPFRFRSQSPKLNDTLETNEFWNDLRRADLLFDRDRLPPPAWICDSRYFFADRRGDTHRRTIHLPGCRPLDRPVTSEEAAAAAEIAKSAANSSTKRLNSKEAADAEARTCDPKSLTCRLLRVAVKSDVICPKKYPRCRSSQAAFTKSVDCPLKYPRCRWFVGKDPSPAKTASDTRATRVKR